MTALHFLSVRDAGARIRIGALSPVTLVEAMLARIGAVDPVIHSFAHVNAEGALQQAWAAEREIAAGGWRGPLHGIPYGVKDIIDVAGMPTRAGSRMTSGDPAPRDAAVVARLRAAGAICLGKLTTYEYGTGTGNDLAELPFSPARNPWDPARFTGGSSTGAGAATAAGTVLFAVGTDTGGSVRLPAAGCGSSGLKPTWAAVERAGILPNCWSLDYPGPLAWHVGDLRLVFETIRTHSRQSHRTSETSGPRERSLAGLRVGVVRRFHTRDLVAHPAIAEGFEAVAQVLGQLGAELIDCEPAASLQDFRACNRILNVAECLAIHGDDYRGRRELMGAALREKLAAGLCVTAQDYIAAQRWRRLLAREVAGQLERCDVLLTCGSLQPAPLFADRAAVAAFAGESAMAVFNLSGHPALVTRAGFTAEGLPVHVQLAGPMFAESLLVSVAEAIEAATDWAQRRPEPLERAGQQATFPPGHLPAPDQAIAEAAGRVAELGGIRPSPRDLAEIGAQAGGIAAALARFPRSFDKELAPLSVPEPEARP